MFTRKQLGALAFVTSAAVITGSGSALTVMPAADAAPGHHAVAAHRPATSKTLSSSALARVRDRQRQMVAQHRSAPSFAKAASTTFTVDTTDDSDLADSAGTTCVDAATGDCSLRAAVDAANNLQKPVTIVLRKHTYTLDSGDQLTVSNAAGTSITGKGRAETAIAGTDTSRVFLETQPTSGLSSPLLFLSELTVTGGHADNGGGLYLDDQAGGATLVLDHVSVAGNTGTTTGGGLFSVSNSTIYATRSAFKDNSAPNAAGLWTYWSNVDFTNVTISGNSTPAGTSGGGAGWFNQYGVSRVRGGSISGNTAGDPGDSSTFGYGAGLADYYGDTAFTDVTIDDNTAVDDEGGAIYANSALLEITGGSISHNRVSGDDGTGGGISTADGAQLGLHGVTMAGNKVSDGVVEAHGGGAIFIGAAGFGNQVTIDGGTTITRSNGGAVYLYASEGHVDADINHARLTHNANSSANGYSGGGCGGAICVYADLDAAANLSMSHDTLADNSSESPGENGSGAIGVATTSFASARVHVIHTLFEDNVAGISGLGGALGVLSEDNAASLRIETSTFRRNRAGTSGDHGWGGAVGIRGSVAYSDANSTYVKNRSVGDDAYGGAVYSDTQQSSRFTGSTFIGNSSGPKSGGDGHGGAVFANNQAGTAFSQVTMTGNRTATYGGAIDTSSDGFAVSVERSTLADNTAGNDVTSGYGGSIYTFDGVLTVENSTITDNHALQGTDSFHSLGGGIYIEGYTLGLRYSTITGNRATRGGGVWSESNTGSIVGTILTGNRRPGGARQECLSDAGRPVLHSLGGNVLGQKACVTGTRSGDKVGKKPRLHTLEDNGGPTMTMALSAKSPAVGIATYQCPTTDQRGKDRPSNHCDAGAYELPKK